MNPNAIFIIVSFIIVFGVFFIALIQLTKKKSKIPPQEEGIDFDTLMILVNSRYSTYQDLRKAIEYFFAYYQDWKLSRAQKRNFLFAACLHKNTNAKLILQTQKRLSELNPDMRDEFEKIVKRAMDIR
ncbi:hypothetical protein BKH46_06375 [Helicobacter sp. 12S02634-8]|uniref:hypothetical protein n=1 Tax=Helicobacter sp. 12S02634-8 TaxID=1476199 RepID=UPI000BA7B267|nr:hypothetical protein [Helicobacter sp. 12S02634-8]PAF46836.1 hypothetical protein BKH46_06375 [Helicobacter sp. 12S02634-8]